MPVIFAPDPPFSRRPAELVTPLWIALHPAYRIDPLLARTVTTEPVPSGTTVRSRWLAIP